MSAQPIFDAIDAGHWFRTVTVDEAKKHIGWKEGEFAEVDRLEVELRAEAAGKEQEQTVGDAAESKT